MSVNPTDIWKSSLLEAEQILHEFAQNPAQIEVCGQFTQWLIEAARSKSNVFACGNGGSHCDAMHFAEELTGRYRGNRRPIGALALGDAAHVTCTANDYGFDHVFSRQLEGLARQGDLLITLSTSGNSANILNVLTSARKIGVRTVALLGRDGGKAKTLADLSIVIPAKTSDRIQEMHIKILHTVIEAMERELFPENYA